jgi:hypothetical protein
MLRNQDGMMKSNVQQSRELQEKKEISLKKDEESLEVDDYEIEILALGAVDVSSRVGELRKPVEEEEARASPKETITVQIESDAGFVYGSMRQDVRIEDPDDE